MSLIVSSKFDSRIMIGEACPQLRHAETHRKDTGALCYFCCCCFHLLGYGALTPAILGVSHLRTSALELTSPNKATIKHILAESVRLSFRRLLM